MMLASVEVASVGIGGLPPFAFTVIGRLRVLHALILLRIVSALKTVDPEIDPRDTGLVRSRAGQMHVMVTGSNWKSLAGITGLQVETDGR